MDEYREPTRYISRLKKGGKVVKGTLCKDIQDMVGMIHGGENKERESKRMKMAVLK